MTSSKTLTKREITGGIVSLIGALVAIVGNLYLFLGQYGFLRKGYAAAENLPGVKIVTWVFPAMSDVIMIAGLALLIASFGYFAKKSWAWFVSVLAVILGLLGTWMALVWPLMISESPVYLPIFLTFLVIWFIFLLYVKPIAVKNFVLITFAGIAMVLNFMNGVASLNKLVGTLLKGQAMAEKQGVPFIPDLPDPLFVATQQLNWIAAIAWGVFIIGVLYRRRWALIMGLGGGVLPLISGTPLAYSNTIDTGEFSLFWIAPTLSLILLILILVKGEKHWMVEHEETIKVPQQDGGVSLN